MNFETLRGRLLVRVRRCVQNGDITERGLARMIGISQPHMHHILKGVRGLSIDTADRLLHRLGISVMDLIDFDPLLPLPKSRQEDTPDVTRVPEGWRSDY